jgi:hypothetical protein
MSAHFPQHWFLELDGKRMGPFSPEQVLGLLADGEIPEGLTVHPVDASGREDPSGSMTAAAMREAYFQDDRIPTAEPSWTQASGPLKVDIGVGSSGPDWDSSPSIPLAREDREEIDREAAANLATARRLFDLFQSARERRAKFAPLSSEEIAKLDAQQGAATAWLRSPVAAAVAASIMVIAGVRFMASPTNVTEDAQRELAQSKAAQAEGPDSRSVSAPVRPAAPPRPVAKIQNNWKPSLRPAAAPPPPPAPAPERRDFENSPDSVVARVPARPGMRPMAKPFRAGMPPARPDAPQAPEQNWAEPQDPSVANDAGRPPEGDPGQPPALADGNLAPGQMPPEQPFIDPNGNLDGQQPPPEQPQDTYQVE